MDFNNTLAYARTRRISQFGAGIADGKLLEVELDRSGSGYRHVCELDHVVDSVRHSVVMSPSTGA